MDIWNLYEFQSIFLKYFPVLANESEIQYNYRIVRIPGLFSTSLEIDKTFLLSDEELINYLITQEYIRYEAIAKHLTRLSCYYIIQFSEKTKDEFYRYLDRFTIQVAFNILHGMSEAKEEKNREDYFARRWEKGVNTYQDIIDELRAVKSKNVYDYLSDLLIQVFRKLTQENNDEEIDRLILIADKIDPFPWIQSFLPYGSDTYLNLMFFKTRLRLEILALIYREALYVSKNRLDYIINYIASPTQRLYSYRQQLNIYLDNEDWDQDWRDYETPEELTQFLTIVTEIIKLGNINYKTIPVIPGSKFEIWVDRTENQV